MIYLYGGDDRVYASMKIMLYTIFGSLIMLISLIYIAIIASNSIGYATISIKEISSALLTVKNAAVRPIHRAIPTQRLTR
jgi:NADH-quinone oxidoreductase subunit M